MTDAFSAHQKRQCVKRELGFRRRVYPRKVESGGMTQAAADREIAIMEAIERDYATQADAEKRAGELAL